MTGTVHGSCAAVGIDAIVAAPTPPGRMCA
jgi:hypothetical protein